MAANCSNPQCQITNTDVCLEGFSEVIECPTYLIDETTEQESLVEEDAVPTEEPDNEGLVLKGQSTLGPQAADGLLKMTGGRIVACVGPANVGKTTLFASLYDLLQLGPVADWSFGGSATIFPFEELCHSARASSRRIRAETPRTPASDDLTFYHLALRSASKLRVDLFLGDRAGEIYSSAADSSRVCRELTEVVRADVVLILVDAECLCSQTERHSTKRYVRSIIEAISKENMLLNTARIIVTLTKFDIALKNELGEVAKAEHKKIIDSTIDILGGETEVIGHIVAARPASNDQMLPGHGIPSLLMSIIDCNIPRTPYRPTRQPTPERSFCDPEFAL